jgi:hypothetical protein
VSESWETNSPGPYTKPSPRLSTSSPDWHDRLAPLRRKRQLIAELERLSGKKALLQEEAA